MFLYEIFSYLQGLFAFTLKLFLKIKIYYFQLARCEISSRPYDLCNLTTSRLSARHLPKNFTPTEMRFVGNEQM